mmetsp:Transcript_11534/g.26209  ORF Transcript_11534/g.26209 Transcript_11534/m.26209 type:complete len:81 (+) Transcript_11534:74-316(+)
MSGKEKQEPEEASSAAPCCVCICCGNMSGGNMPSDLAESKAKKKDAKKVAVDPPESVTMKKGFFGRGNDKEVLSPNSKKK